MFSNQRSDRRSRVIPISGMAIATSLFAASAIAMTDKQDRNSELTPIEQGRATGSEPAFIRNGPPGVLVQGESVQLEDDRNLTVPDRGPVGRAPAHGDTIS